MKNEIESLFEEANAHYYNKDIDNATKIYVDIVKKEPRHYPSYERLALIELAQNNTEKAIDYLKKYLKYNAQNPDIWNQLGNIYFDGKDYKNSIKCYKKTIWLDSSAFWAYYNVGLAISEEGTNPKNQDKAKDWFRKAARINPEYSPALNELGIYYQNKYDYQRAKEFFLRAIKYDSTYKYPYFNMAKIYKANNLNDKAKLYLNKAIKVDPDYTSAMNYLGIIYFEEEQYNAALHYYTKSLISNPSYKYSYYNIGLVFSSTGKYRKAYTVFNKALEIDSKYQLALQEKERLERDYKDQITFGEELTDADLNPDEYKKVVAEGEGGILFSDEYIENSKELFTEKFGRNITKLARENALFRILGRDKEINSILETLFSLKKNNPLLIGKAGVGKTAVVEGLAQRIASGDVPEFFKNKEILEINMGILVAGTTFRGDFEKRLKNIVEEVSKNKNLILFIDEIHTILGAGESGGSNLDAANILKPALAKGDLRCIGATTVDEYLKFFQKDSALDRRFFKVQIDELDKTATFDILSNLREKMASHFKVSITDESLKLIIELSDSELKNKVFPDKAIDILEKTMSRTALRNQKIVDDEIIKNVIADFTGYNVFATEDERYQHLMGLEDYLKTRCYGQNEPIAKITSSIVAAKSKLNFGTNRPDGVILLTGPSGVGKTYIAREVAKYLYGNYDKCVSINMSEYTEAHSISKLIGSPPGYIGHDNVSVLNQLMETNPSSVLLLDEIDKASPEVIKIFLRIFEEGKINDTSGKTIYFSNCTIIMTSNIIMQSGTIGFDNNKNDLTELKEYNKLKDNFSKEFINRIDQVVNFNYIEKETAREIIKNILIPRADQIFTKRNLLLTFDDNFIDYILNLGYDRIKGVRNLERVFEKSITTSLSEKRLPSGKNSIAFTVLDNKIIIN
ncbi:MAG: hypothetical protein A2015_02795 [Spirochaetes bacterium GWF1_31_7]|nr:MAG: hypothetical protein A2Y30_10030 [Spirochaetes bacterium GWE1_32_154]OHD49395.1 MAG: hypothetical protein A2015_02795 [Spirochaetes bacterium GWF1_31_7]OHD51105.1 MAG: hypothetical protein A2Y29_07455 [Spirochaetes bacterium GWE2_31_10]OHD73377.1 MAG: hypothetical protein A2355_15675 [Spirochaetes bacterium RIFOXYB1_FULL_32_8]HBD94248.1 hypothetical protein [Spirochaetia bacterium]